MRSTNQPCLLHTKVWCLSQENMCTVAWYANSQLATFSVDIILTSKQKEGVRKKTQVTEGGSKKINKRYASNSYIIDSTS